jgi:hypothetical protein
MVSKSEPYFLSIFRTSKVDDAVHLLTSSRPTKYSTVILRLGTGSSDLICVQLKIVDLDSECLPGYWGLSYMGQSLPSHPSPSSPPTQHEILCDGKSYLVRSNLYDFLKKFNGARSCFWIDAICLYPGRYKTEYLGSLRLGPLFSEGFRLRTAFASPCLSFVFDSEK